MLKGLLKPVLMRHEWNRERRIREERARRMAIFFSCSMLLKKEAKVR